MSNYMIAYHGGNQPSSKEEGMAQMGKWKAWVESLGDKVVNPGTPFPVSKIVTASGKKTIKMSKKEWTTIGKTAGWMKQAQNHKWTKEKDEEWLNKMERDQYNEVEPDLLVKRPQVIIGKIDPQVANKIIHYLEKHPRIFEELKNEMKTNSNEN